jgi:hypothetical protein
MPRKQSAHKTWLKATLAANPSVLSSTVKGMAQTAIHSSCQCFWWIAGITGGVLSIPGNPAAGIWEKELRDPNDVFLLAEERRKEIEKQKSRKKKQNRPVKRGH